MADELPSPPVSEAFRQTEIPTTVDNAAGQIKSELAVGKPVDKVLFEMSEKTVGSSRPEEPSIESKERLQRGGFSIRFDKTGLDAERKNILPQGQLTLETFLNFPEVLEIPKGATFVVGDNGSGKSTVLGLVDLLGRVNGMYKIGQGMAEGRYGVADNYHPNTWEQERDQLIARRGGMVGSEWKKYGIAPNILKHVSIKGGSENLASTRLVRIPEVAGALWASVADQERGSWEPDARNGGAAVYEEGRGLDDDEVLGSTQQIIDQRVFEDLRREIGWSNQPEILLLDEPTANADLKRTMNLLKELKGLEEVTKHPVTTIVATNEGLLSIHQGINVIDMSHPDRGVHKKKDYPLDSGIEEGLREMGYAPINTQAAV